jgi:hypothetical protein
MTITLCAHFRACAVKSKKYFCGLEASNICEASRWNSAANVLRNCNGKSAGRQQIFNRCLHCIYMPKHDMLAY